MNIGIVHLKGEYGAWSNISEAVNFTEMVPVIGIEGTMPCACHCYTWDYLLPGLGHLMNVANMEIFMLFPTRIHTVML